MEDHLKNKQRLEQEWVALCGYEAEPCATTIAFKVCTTVIIGYRDNFIFRLFSIPSSVIISYFDCIYFLTKAYHNRRRKSPGIKCYIGYRYHM